jgi:hypothetical protein
VCLGCVVRVESIGQDPTMSLWGKSCRRGVTWASLMRDTCDGFMCERRGVGYPLEKISYPVPLRTGMS